jgi:hypothetical protein
VTLRKAQTNPATMHLRMELVKHTLNILILIYIEFVHPSCIVPNTSYYMGQSPSPMFTPTPSGMPLSYPNQAAYLRFPQHQGGVDL